MFFPPPGCAVPYGAAQFGNGGKMTDIRTIADLRPDPANANAGTERGEYMVRQSLAEVGAARSIVTDRNGIILAGNKTAEAWADIAADSDVIAVHTDGRKLVVVVRDDLDLAADEGHRARRAALFDNRASEVSYRLDLEALAAHADSGVPLDDMYFENELQDLAKQLQREQREELALVADDGEQGVSREAMPEQRYPLAIVLTLQQRRQWDDYKGTINERSDTAAFMQLLEAI